ncbi:hypothetical protein ACMD2_16018 [Ananas comosus]|uniref:Embryo defective 1273 n=1 Tax=Ananas comosus TaxID=4615 RepID=A0A199UFK4_ANACO|nr:hypothetical protein ACMD2_16018 [Ananas comosus]
MEAILIASSSSLPVGRSKVVVSQRYRNQAYHSYHLYSESYSKRRSSKSFVKLQAAEHFGDPKYITNYVDNLSKRLVSTLPEPIKVFPWKEAKNKVLEQLLVVGEKALKWSLIVLFVVSAALDLYLAISRDRELLIPLGLFVGIALADFLTESLHALFQKTTQDGESPRHLVSIGSFFALVKIISLSLKLPGRVLLSHVGNGGLMQVLWSANKMRKNDNFEESNGVSEPSSELAKSNV